MALGEDIKEPIMNTILEADYLIIGSGAVGMAFADTLLTETDATMIIVDKLDSPGGHWNFAYPFVKLHQPSAFYGVNSMELSKGRIDQVGYNKGLNDLATGPEVLAYFKDVMQHHFLPSGRVAYYPLCDYRDSGIFTCYLTGETFEVKVKKKTVDATYLKTEIPATHTPNFEVARGVQFMPLNHLPGIDRKPSGYVVIGGGKTAMDACLWLLEHHIDPDLITWIKPRDAWLLNRENFQLDDAHFENFLKDQAAQMEALAHADTIPDLFDRLEKGGSLVRIDTDVEPTMYRCATVSPGELEQLRRIRNVIRKGRVKGIHSDQIVLEKGTIATKLGNIHIDCSASGIWYPEIKPVFDGDTITLQTVRTCQPTFSAAFIAFIEATYDDQALKNELCTVIPIPSRAVDWILMLAIRMKNQQNWNSREEIFKWLQQSRLEGGFAGKLASIPKDNKAQQALLERIQKNIEPAVAKLHVFVQQLRAEKAL